LFESLEEIVFGASVKVGRWLVEDKERGVPARQGARDADQLPLAVGGSVFAKETTELGPVPLRHGLEYCVDTSGTRHRFNRLILSQPFLPVAKGNVFRRSCFIAVEL